MHCRRNSMSIFQDFFSSTDKIFILGMFVVSRFYYNKLVNDKLLLFEFVTSYQDVWRVHLFLYFLFCLEIKEMNADILSKLWFTYRKNFPPIGKVIRLSDICVFVNFLLRQCADIKHYFPIMDVKWVSRKWW